MPASSLSVEKSSLIRFDKPTHWASVSSLLATLVNCSCVSRAYRSTPGIDFASCSAVNRPPSLLEIVPPVATKWTRGNATWARSAACDAAEGADAVENTYSKQSSAATTTGRTGVEFIDQSLCIGFDRRGHEREPFAQQPCSFIGRLTVKRHERSRHPGTPRDLCAPARRRNGRNLDLIRTPGNFFFVVMDRHVWKVMILRVRKGDSSEAGRESGDAIRSGVAIRATYRTDFFFVS